MHVFMLLFICQQVHFFFVVIIFYVLWIIKVSLWGDYLVPSIRLICFRPFPLTPWSFYSGWVVSEFRLHTCMQCRLDALISYRRLWFGPGLGFTAHMCVGTYIGGRYSPGQTSPSRSVPALTCTLGLASPLLPLGYKHCSYLCGIWTSALSHYYWFSLCMTPEHFYYLLQAY